MLSPDPPRRLMRSNTCPDGRREPDAEVAHETVRDVDADVDVLDGASSVMTIVLVMTLMSGIGVGVLLSTIRWSGPG